MKSFIKSYGIPIGVFSFFLLFIGIVYVVASLGKAYQSNISTYAPPVVKNQEISGKTRKIVRKITLTRIGETGCTELSADGAVRIYSTCGSTLVDAKRLFNLTNMRRLFDKVADLSAIDNQNIGTGPIYEVRVETDTGTEVYYVALEDAQADTTGLTTIVDQVLGDVPTPSPQGAVNTPTSALSPTRTRTPTLGPSPTMLPSTPTPPSSTGAPFSCDFMDQGGPDKPYRISNTVCTSGPTPAP